MHPVSETGRAYVWYLSPSERDGLVQVLEATAGIRSTSITREQLDAMLDQLRTLPSVQLHQWVVDLDNIQWDVEGQPGAHPPTTRTGIRLIAPTEHLVEMACLALTEAHGYQCVGCRIASAYRKV